MPPMAPPSPDLGRLSVHDSLGERELSVSRMTAWRTIWRGQTDVIEHGPYGAETLATGGTGTMPRGQEGPAEETPRTG